MRLLACGAALGLVVAAPRVLHAQSADSIPSIPPVVFLEKAYISGLTPTGKHVLFEGQPTVHYFFHNSLSSELWQKKGGFAYATPLSAMLQVRMLLDDVLLQNGERSVSEPVMTPSYRIGVRQQVFYLKRLANPSRYLLYGGALGYLHYSNGQHGCTYVAFTRNSAGECEVNALVLLSGRTANLIDGDFSTTYFSEAFDVKWAEQTDPFGTMKRNYTAGIEFRQDPLGAKPGGTNREQALEYGQQQVELRLGTEYHRFGKAAGIWRLATDFTWRWGGGTTHGLNAQQVEVSYVFDGLSHAGLFVRQHWGFDYYNIHFQETKPFTNVGVVWDIGRLDHLNSAFRR